MEKTTEEMIAELTSRLEKAESAVNSVAAKQKDTEDKEKQAAHDAELKKQFEEEFKKKYNIGVEPQVEKKADEDKEKAAKAEENKGSTDNTDDKDKKADEQKDNKDNKDTSANIGVGGKQNVGDDTPKYKTVADIIAAAKHY